ncbi:MAG: PIN domain-containing protein [Thaumarchaeota archaeon]|nr:PIN domain-containing protein [Nitrososphaerota archaeon]
MKIVIDSYAWIEIFSGSTKGEEARNSIAKADSVFTPDIVLAEVARKYSREGMEETTIHERLRTILETSESLSIDDTIAIEAAKSSIQLEKNAKETKLSKPSLFDAIVLAIAKTNRAKVLTGDQHFKGLHETIWLGGS